MAKRTGSQVVADDPLTDLEIAEAMTAELEDYIVKDDLYRTLFAPTSTGEQRIVMTGGDLLARLHRLSATNEQLSSEMRPRIEAVVARAEAIIYSLKTRFKQRLLREMKARLDSLRWYLDDCTSDPVRCRTNFPFEMRNRQRVEEILKHLDGDVPEDLQALLNSIDHRIKQITHGTTFIWDEQLNAAYPSMPYWYLYVSP